MHTINVKGHGEVKMKDIDGSLKVWIGGLPDDVTKVDLEAHFAQVGAVIVAEPMPRNTGCVAYATAEEAKSAIDTLNGSFVGASSIQVDVWTQKPVAGWKNSAGKGQAAFPAFGKGLAGKGFARSPMVQTPQFQKLAMYGGVTRAMALLGGYGAGAGYGAGYGKGKGKGKGFPGNPLKTMDNALKIWVNGVPELGGKWKNLEAHFEQVGKTSWVELMGKGKACIACKTAEEAAAALTLNGVIFEGVALEVDVWAKPAE